jgi:hypothetical protein
MPDVPKIGFNPQDRFMVALGNTLVVVTSDGSVFGADVVGSGQGRFLEPVVQLTGARIGFNPQDRFMMAAGDTLIVVADGNVFGSQVKGTRTGAFMGLSKDGKPMGPVVKRELQPVFPFGGAKIGFNPQDRFMVALGNTLVVVTSDGNVYGGQVTGQSLSSLAYFNPVPLPARLQFRLRYFIEHASNDDFLQGASDEVYLSAVGADSASVVLGENGEPVAETITTQTVGDVTEDSVRNPWRNNPHVLMEFDLQRPSDWPRSFVVNLLFVEHDDGDLEAAFEKLEREVGETVKKAAEAAATAAAGALAGAAIGSVIPGIGTAVGAAVGALAGAAYDALIPAIKEGLGDDAFTPRPVQLLVSDPDQIRQHPSIGLPQHIDVNELGAKYTLEYDWFLVE